MQRRDLLMAGLAATAAPVVRAATVAPAARAATPAAVLELFTSQGCSSCPPADALLGRLAREPGIIALAWHVDYWNRLGWSDPFSSAIATARQRRYAEALHDEVYTPALVVNGVRMVVGSDEGAVLSAIGAAGGFALTVTLRRDVGLGGRGGDHRSGQGNTQGGAQGNTQANAQGDAQGDAQLGAHTWIADIGHAGQPVSALLATYDPQRSTAVAAGENSGRRLTDYRIVDSAALLGTWDGAARTLALPGVAPGRGTVLLLQSADLRMLGAVDLPPG